MMVAQWVKRWSSGQRVVQVPEGGASVRAPVGDI